MITETDTAKVWEALYAINRAIDPDPEYRSDWMETLVTARDMVWSVLVTIDPKAKD